MGLFGNNEERFSLSDLNEEEILMLSRIVDYFGNYSDVGLKTKFSYAAISGFIKTKKSLTKSNWK